MRNIFVTEAVVIDRRKGVKRDYIIAFTKLLGKVECVLSLSQESFRRLEVGDYAILDLSQVNIDQFIITGLFFVKTNFGARADQKNFVFLNLISEILNTTFENRYASSYIFQNLKNFVLSLSEASFSSLLESILLELGINSTYDNPISKINQIEVLHSTKFKGVDDLRRFYF